MVKPCKQSYSDYIKYILKYKENSIKEISLNVYIQNLKKIFKELFDCETPNINFFRDYRSVIKYIDSMGSNASRKTMCTSIIVLLKSYKKFPKTITKIYSKKLTDIAYKQNAIYIKNQKTKRENINWISFDELSDILKDLELQTKDTKNLTTRQILDIHQKYILLRLYTDLPPVRNDYAYTKVFKEHNDTLEKEQENYIILKDNVLFLQKYKTSKFYGTKVIKLPVSIISLIKKFEKLKKELYPDQIEHNFLLVNTTDLKPMSRVNLTKCLNKIFYPKKISTTIIRKIYLSNKYPITHSMEEMQEDADIMGHDIGTARKIYTKML